MAIYLSLLQPLWLLSDFFRTSGPEVSAAHALCLVTQVSVLLHLPDDFISPSKQELFL